MNFDWLSAGTQEYLELLVITFLRLAALVGVMPGFGTSVVPVRIKLGLTVGMALYLSPFVDTQNYILGINLVCSEITIGFLIGIGLRFLVWALQLCGTIAAQTTSLSQLLGNSGGDPMPAIGQILVTSGLALFFVLDLHFVWINSTVYLYEFLPIGYKISGEDIAEWSVAKVALMFSLGFQLSAPFLILSMLYNVTLGVINKAMPQLMVAFVGAPVVTFCGLMFLSLSASIILGVWAANVELYLINPFELK